MTYYLYHIPGKKIGVTRDLKNRVEEQQGYRPGEYSIIMKSDNIKHVSEQELYWQEKFGYRIDEVPYNKLKCNNMRINVTEQTTTFPCPVNKLKGQLMDNMGMHWETDHGDCRLTDNSVQWILKNVQTSKYNEKRCYIYNKAFARWFDNNDPYNGKTRTGALSPTGADYRIEKEIPCDCITTFDLIREWADKRGLYDKGDPKTQYLKLVEEVGELGRAILKDDYAEQVDAIGDIVVVLTNLAELAGTNNIEDCIRSAYETISKRTGKMINGTFVKDE